jgi:hypothetical protein
MHACACQRTVTPHTHTIYPACGTQRRTRLVCPVPWLCVLGVGLQDELVEVVLGACLLLFFSRAAACPCTYTPTTKTPATQVRYTAGGGHGGQGVMVGEPASTCCVVCREYVCAEGCIDGVASTPRQPLIGQTGDTDDKATAGRPWRVPWGGLKARARVKVIAGEREERDAQGELAIFTCMHTGSEFIYGVPSLFLLRPSKQEPSSTMRLVHARVQVTRQRGREMHVARKEEGRGRRSDDMPYSGRGLPNGNPAVREPSRGPFCITSSTSNTVRFPFPSTPPPAQGTLQHSSAYEGARRRPPR